MSSKWKRKGGQKFVMLDGYVMRSAAWRALTPNDKALYLELKWRYDGVNNGMIGLSARDAAKLLGISQMTALRTFQDLQQKGFIFKAKASGFNIKSRSATEWRLTEYPCNVTGDLPTKEFTRWAENKTQHHQESAQHHHESTSPPAVAGKTPDSISGGAVRPVSASRQHHYESTYSTTTPGRMTDAKL